MMSRSDNLKFHVASDRAQQRSGMYNRKRKKEEEREKMVDARTTLLIFSNHLHISRLEESHFATLEMHGDLKDLYNSQIK